MLLDANIVIEAHELQVWDKLKAAYRLSLPATVSREEALFYFAGGTKTIIRLQEQITNKEIDEVEASADEIRTLYGIFEPWFVETLDPGETEGLALLVAGHPKDVAFCTADSPAIKALAMVGLSHLGLPFESLLSKAGLTKKLRVQFSDSFFRECIRRGKMNLVTRNGLV